MNASPTKPVALDPVPRRLRIAVLNRTFSPTGGGAERYSIALVEQLAARHDIHVFAQVVEHHFPGVSYHRVSMPLRKPRWVNQLWFATATWWATRRGFDVVHSHENTWHGDVQTVHVLPVKHNLFQGRTGWRLALRWVKVLTSPRLLAYMGLERARYTRKPGRTVVVTSPSLQRILALSYPAWAMQTEVITPGIVLPNHSVSSALKVESRLGLGLPLDAPCLLFVGNDYRKKGLFTLLQAMVKLPPNVVLAVVGNAAGIPEFRAQAQALKIDSRVFFLGPLHDVGPAYLSADALVHPTLEDTFAMVVLEAMAHGLPVAVSGPAYCGISELLKPGVEALLIDDPKNAEHLAQTLRGLLFNASLRAQLVQGGQNFAAAYPWQRLALAQESVYLVAVRAKSA